MGTYYSIKFYAADRELNTSSLQQEIDAELELVNDQMSTYREHSELVQFNRQQTTDVIPLSGAMHKVVAEALRIGAESAVIDITVGPLVDLWGFGPKGRITHAPEQQQIDEIRNHVGLSKLRLTDEGLAKLDPRVEIDLSTIAKGYGVDQVANLLESHNILNYIVDIGGEMRVKGKKPAAAWRIAIEKPVASGRSAQRILAPGDMAIATSGDYRNYFEEGGVRYSHLIDPRTGQPIQHRTVSVTVLHPSAMTADGYATVLMVLDEKEALAFANKHQLAALIIVKTDDGFDEIATEAFKPYLNQQR
ncbi:FAD:protein FMN transferase [Chromatiaceae bacterium AAb-1]|nr:FAD:protein FMN transferase [Chromatiaceae bacterium AAb-1]